MSYTFAVACVLAALTQLNVALANGDNDPTLRSPVECTMNCNAPPACCPNSPLPPGEPEIGETVKRAVEAAKSVASDYKNIIDIVAEFYETEAKWFAGLATFIIVVMGALGWNSIRDVKREVDKNIADLNKEKELVVRARQKITRQSLRLNVQERNITSLQEKLETETKTLHSDLTNNILALTNTFGAFVRLTSYINAMQGQQQPLASDLEEAEKGAREVIEKIKPKDAQTQAWAYGIYGTTRHLARDWRGAYNALKEARRLNPDNASVTYNLACAANRLGLRDEALDWLREAVQTRPAYRSEAWDDEDFADLKTAEEFKGLTGQGQGQGQVS